MNNLRNEKIRSVLLALLLAVSFLILDGGIQCGYQRYWLTGDASKVEAASPEREQNQDPRGHFPCSMKRWSRWRKIHRQIWDSIELEEKVPRARMGERGVRIEEER